MILFQYDTNYWNEGLSEARRRLITGTKKYIYTGAQCEQAQLTPKIANIGISKELLHYLDAFVEQQLLS